MADFKLFLFLARVPKNYMETGSNQKRSPGPNSRNKVGKTYR